MNYRKSNPMHVRKCVVVTNKRGQLFGALAWDAATIQHDLCVDAEQRSTSVGSSFHAPVHKAKRVKMRVF